MLVVVSEFSRRTRVSARIHLGPIGKFYIRRKTPWTIRYKARLLLRVLFCSWPSVHQARSNLISTFWQATGLCSMAANSPRLPLQRSIKQRIR